MGGNVLIAEQFAGNGGASGKLDAPSTHRRRIPQLPLSRSASFVRQHPGVVSDVVAVVFAALDIFLVVPTQEQGGAHLYQYILMAIACVALVLRRRFPFAVTVITIPGFLVGWSPLAAMIALGTLAWKRGFGWKLICAGLLAWACRFVIWPIDQFTQESWHEHIDDGMWAAITAGMPIAIGLLITTRQALRTRISELAASRVREQQLHARAVRADERAKIAREMHDVVSYQVTLMAMQAGALQMTGGDEQSREIAGTIRKLCGSTLDELRGLVGALRGPADGDAGSRLADIVELARQNGTELDSDTDLGAVDVPAAVAAAAYRTVQEALTNAHKHAPGAQTSVRIAAEHTKLVVEVRNGPPTRGTPTRAAQLPSGGHGLIGLQERAAMLDGTFDSAPTPDGGFVVTATYPLKPKQARAQTNTPAPAAS